MKLLRFRPVPSSLVLCVLALAARVFAQDGSYRTHGFGPPIHVGSFQTGSGDIIFSGDVTGEGLAEWIVFHTLAGPTWAAGDVRVRQPDVQARVLFNLAGVSGFCTSGQVPVVGDVNGDGREDLVRFIGTSSGEPARGDVWVALATGAGFAAQTKWHESMAVAGEEVRLGDVNGDARADALLFPLDASGGVRVALANAGGSFGEPGALLLTGFAKTGESVRVADFNGDGRADVMSVEYISGGAGDSQIARVALADGSGAFHLPAQVGARPGQGIVFVGDVTGDRRADLLRPVSSGPGVTVQPWSGGALPTSAIAHQECNASGRAWLGTGRVNRDVNADLLVLEPQSPIPTTLETMDAFCAIAGEHAPSRPVNNGEFGFGTRTNGVLLPNGAAVEVPVLLIAAELNGLPPFPPGFSTAPYEQMLFGPQEPSIDGMLRNASGGRVRLRRAGPGVTPIVRNVPVTGNVINFGAYYAGLQGFDFAPFDTNGDGVVQNNELVIFTIFNQPATSLGTTAFDTSFITYTNGDMGRAVNISCPIATASYLTRFDVFAHEFMHTLGAADFYGPNFSYALGMTLMCPTLNSASSLYLMPDAWHRMAMGWVRPRVFDARLYPGTSVIDFAQFNSVASPLSRPPALLYDSSRGPTEFYLLEARSRTWNGGPVFVPGGAGAGYDSSFGTASPFSAGAVVWACATDASGGVDAFIQIGPGADGSLQSVIAAGSDDIIVGGWISPGPDHITQSLTPFFAAQRIAPGANLALDSVLAGDDVIVAGQIAPGPNGSLDSTRTGDDVVTPDDVGIYPFAVFSSSTPANPGTRAFQALTRTSGSTSPQWFDGSSTGFTISADQITPAGRQAIVEWSTAGFSPFIDSVRPTSVIPGGSVTVTGRLGRANAGQTKLWLMGTSGYSGRIPLTPTRWTGESARFTLPVDIAYGTWRLLVTQDETNGTLTSNTVTLNVPETSLYGQWRNFHYPPPQQFITTLDLPPYDRLLGAAADPDGDGLANLAEFALGSDPFVGNVPGSLIQQTFLPGQGVLLSWQENVNATQEVLVFPEHSADLAEWSELPANDGQETGGMRARHAILPYDETAAKGFVRLRFEQ